MREQMNLLDDDRRDLEKRQYNESSAIKKQVEILFSTEYDELTRLRHRQDDL